MYPISMDSITDIPDWLIVEQPVATSKEVRELVDLQYSILFERALPQLAANITLADICREYHTPTDPNKFRAWILRDDTRTSRYYEALSIAADVMEEEIIRISDAVDTMEDVQRSTLRINTRKFIMAVRNKRHYGETKQVDLNVTNVQQSHLEAIRQLAIEGTCERVETVPDFLLTSDGST